MRKFEVNNTVLYASYGNDPTPAMFAEYTKGGKFYFPYVLVWVGSLFYMKHVG